MHHSAEHDSLLPSAPSFTCCESSLNPAFPRCRCCLPLVSKLLLNWAIYLPPSPSYNVCHLKTRDFFFFETRIHYVAQAILKLAVPLALPTECQNERGVLCAFTSDLKSHHVLVIRSTVRVSQCLCLTVARAFVSGDSDNLTMPTRSHEVLP